MITIPQFDSTHYYLGSLCKRQHDWNDTGKSLRKCNNRTCMECARISDRARDNNGRARHRRANRLAIVQEIKLARGCVDCGYNAHAVALQFDHLPGEKKLRGVAQMTSGTPMKVMLDEIAKCEVVCANCHAVRTAKRQSWTHI